MITLLASIAGFITSIAPEILKFLKDKKDKSHELEILQLQMKYTRYKSRARLEEIASYMDTEQVKTMYSTYKVGVPWVDALNGSVRPVLAYSFFIMYVGIKYMQYSVLHSASEVLSNLNIIWNVDDQAIFAGIISFYFGHRSFNKLRPLKNDIRR